MNSISEYQEEFQSFLSQKIEVKDPKNLYEPIEYIMNLGGKRLRPVLVLVAADIFGNKSKEAMNAALAIEVFHNFSLVHDDIMDQASLRRGKPSVHKKWDLNTGILSGDAMLINAYQLFEHYEGQTFRELAQLFTRTAIQVCEGQQYDVDYENEIKIELADYLKMINYKTGVLVGAALEMGAIIGDASQKCRRSIYNYGSLIGKAFQLKDDYLDIFGEKEFFGKKIGGDIIENKKTFLYLKAFENISPADADALKHLYTLQPENPDQKIDTVRDIFSKSGAAEKTLAAIERYTEDAFEILGTMDISKDEKDYLKNIGEMLMGRKV